MSDKADMMGMDYTQTGTDIPPLVADLTLGTPSPSPNSSNLTFFLIPLS